MHAEAMSPEPDWRLAAAILLDVPEGQGEGSGRELRKAGAGSGGALLARLTADDQPPPDID